MDILWCTNPREFSALATDQAHEQNNAIIKGDGGAIGLTEDPSALRQWLVAGPKVNHLVAGYCSVLCVGVLALALCV